MLEFGLGPVAIFFIGLFMDLYTVSGALTMHMLGKVSTVSSGALTGVQVVGGLFSRHVVGHYVSSLEAVRERGFYQIISESSGPYVAAVWNNFAAEKETWTEQIVTGKLLGKAVNTVGGWIGGNKEAAKLTDFDPPAEPETPQLDS